ncbi:winged helix-turn-helix domain-containing protein [Cohnella lupini]|uniref:Winged helix-turn-helix domain-containing protein n=1 Tax=Cohnella lupini TaxID=1294267 RepID=A0A3D9IC61_9BACL|nr:crosslink repair DNA glycosylase YcaQ family protein [Cohnella lupini]RED59267.1 hypothetical protein DFP95_107106 [Cohnella lupini]
MTSIRMTKRALRRFLLEKQLLLHTPEVQLTSAESLHRRVLDTVRQLECVQIDPVSAVRPNQHLTLAARVAGYEPMVLNEMLRNSEIFEYWANAACLIPMEDYPIFEPTRQRMNQRVESHIEKIRPIAEQVIRRLESEGPLPAKSFDSSERVHGYWDNVNAKTKATSHALNLLTDSAHIRIVGREGNQRLFDVTSRSVPDELLRQAERVDRDEALGAMMNKYFRAYRVFEPSDIRFGWQNLNAKERRNAIESRLHSGEILQVEVEGLNKPYYIISSDRERLFFHEEDRIRANGNDEELSIRFLPPLDNLLWSRKRLADLFDFEYRWEIYTPAVKRKYGYYAMPILAGDRLIGRMDPRLDRKQGRLTVQLLQIEPEIDFNHYLRDRVLRALETFATVHGANEVTIDTLIANGERS